jgi:LacI family transcriptional regulator
MQDMRMASVKIAGVKMADVAAAAGVSPATVSKVLNHRDGVSVDTRSRVLAAVNKLGYEHKGRLLSKEHSVQKTIGIIFARIIGDLAADHFYGAVISGLEEGLSGCKHNVIFRSVSGDAAENRQIIQELLRAKLDGMVFVGYTADDVELARTVKEAGVPLVMIDNDMLDREIDCVVNNNLTGARAMVREMIRLGHRRIHCLNGPMSHGSLRERFEGYRQALEEAGIRFTGNMLTVCEPRYSFAEGYEATKRIFANADPRPTAIFAPTDALAIGSVRALSELKIAIPDEISVAGFDDIETAAHITPALTTVRVFRREMGTMAGLRLLQLMDGVATRPAKTVMSVEIIMRQSLGPVPHPK